MAIYHLSAKILSRSSGRSAVAAAAYRSGSSLHDHRTAQTFDYTRKQGIEYSEILTPPEAPAWAYNRESLWNAVEHAEHRKDAQLAREIEIALPIELSKDQQVALLRDYARTTFVSRGMIADVSLHLDNADNPHAHILLTTRQITPAGFGPKRRDWNVRSELMEWRVDWADLANQHLARAGLDIRIDHRTLEAQGIDLLPGRKIGISAERQQQPDLPLGAAERVAEQREIAAENGRRILEDPNLALRGLTHSQATFTERDIAKYLHGRTDGAEQFQAAYLKVTTSAELVRLGIDDRGRPRFTTKEMLGIEREMLERSERLAASQKHAVSETHQALALAEGRTLSGQQRKAFEYLVGEGDLRVLVGIAGSGKSTLLQTARLAWEAAGYSVEGAALAGIAAEGLEKSSGIPARTLASWEWSWERGREELGERDVLVIDEAGLVGTRQLARVLQRAEEAGAKVVLVGDPEQLQAIEAGAPFRGIAEQVGRAELTEVWRQQIDWQKEATRLFATGCTTEALEAYEDRGFIRAAASRDQARDALLAVWQRDRLDNPRLSQLMLAYTRDEVHRLNQSAREIRRTAEELGHGERIMTERGEREFAAGDRLYFLRGERSLGVKNGSLGTIESVHDGMLQVRMDGEEGRRVVVDSKQYGHLEYGYAATTHKNQGATVDKAYVLATSHFDRHSAYVAMTRHRDDATVFYGKEDFRPEWSRRSAEENFKAVLSRARPKELAHDYLERDEGYRHAEPSGPNRGSVPRDFMSELDALQQRGAEKWHANQPAREKESSMQVSLDQEKDLSLDSFDTPNEEMQKRRDLEHPGLEDDFQL